MDLLASLIVFATVATLFLLYKSPPSLTSPVPLSSHGSSNVSDDDSWFHDEVDDQDEDNDRR